MQQEKQRPNGRPSVSRYAKKRQERLRRAQEEGHLYEVEEPAPEISPSPGMMLKTGSVIFVNAKGGYLFVETKDRERIYIPLKLIRSTSFPEIGASITCEVSTTHSHSHSNKGPRATKVAAINPRT